MKTKKSKWIWSIVIAVVVVGILIYTFAFKGSNTPTDSITVKKGSITEVVSVTGNTTPVKSIDLAFETGGTIASVNKDVGQNVVAGDVIARLNTSDLQAQLASAKANVDAQNATLRSLQAGPRPEDVQSSQASVAKAQQDLANMYSNIPTNLNDAYSKAYDAVRNQLSAFFSNPETNNPQLTFQISDSQLLNNIQFERVQASTELNTWQKEITALGASVPTTSSLEIALQAGSNHLNKLGPLFTNAATAVIEATSLPTATSNAYKTSGANAVTEMSSASTELSGLQQNIASQKLTVQGLQAQLALKLAGSTSESIDAQKAVVEQAQASAQSIQVKISKASLISPIEGVITVQNAKTGQIAAPGSVLVSIISGSNLEIDAAIPETDIGKIAVGNPVTMSFDAFTGETFDGTVFYIDPAPTTVSGAVNYKIKISLNKPDPRIKSGLTANLDIKTLEKDGVLILPQFAILQTDQGAFVKTSVNGTVTQVPITLGIHDDSGNVEVASGVTEGEEVMNIGLK